MISTEKFFVNFVALICCIGVCLILGISINVIEQRIKLKNLEIENYKIYKILMKKKGSIEVVPRNYKIFKRAQEKMAWMLDFMRKLFQKMKWKLNA